MITMHKGSHASYTYLKPVDLKYRLFNFKYKCQNKDILEQYNSGVRLFDIRIRYKEKPDPIICYGPVDYDISWSKVLFDLENLNKISTSDDKIYIRLTLEPKKSGSNRYQEKRFSSTCRDLENKFPGLGFFGGQRRSDWKQVYEFKKQANLHIKRAYASSVCSGGLIWPWYFSKTEKNKIWEEFILDYSDNFKWFMTDYV